MIDHREVCEYCGEGILIEIIPMRFQDRDGFAMQCQRCGATGPWGRDKLEAVESFENSYPWSGLHFDQGYKAL